MRNEKEMKKNKIVDDFRWEKTSMRLVSIYTNSNDQQYL